MQVNDIELEINGHPIKLARGVQKGKVAVCIDGNDTLLPPTRETATCILEACFGRSIDFTTAPQEVTFQTDRTMSYEISWLRKMMQLLTY